MAWSKNEEKQVSKFMSLVLRHEPVKFGIDLDFEGYCSIDRLLEAIHQRPGCEELERKHIEEVVANCKKQRFTIVNDLIRARYGHSKVKVVYEEGTPPSILYHGTNVGAIDSILSSGIKSMNRKYVHLSETTGFATLAGQRRGELVIITVDTENAIKQGVKFYYAGNEVWLSEFIPPTFISTDKIL